MHIYGGPNPEHSVYMVKFERVRRDIYVTQPGDLDTEHRKMAILLEILGKIALLRENEPDEVDAGDLRIVNLESRKEIVVANFSTTLGLPVTDIARERTLFTIGDQSPGFNIKKGPYKLFQGKINI